ncbi:ATP-binding protein [Micromonospora purpureochromogenes]|uniref:ATP-binding protein n=1 Tax=Micromonospora purpureochromogenes TaxID=47872 RepID=UPI00362CC400
MQTIDIKPDPRILIVLGDIEFQPWQCLAELIDNAFDVFLSGRSAGVRPTVTISLPTRSSDPRSAEVWVADNGHGMDLETLNNAVRAGWTSNSAHGSLGLFGMGFNIATARLGRRTRVRTSRPGDPYWIVVTLDLPALAAGGTYDAPVSFELKDDPEEHGTTVVISALKPDQFDALSRNEQAIRSKLGDVYSYLLREHDFEILVNRKRVRPRMPCIWDEKRHVTRSGVDIPAVRHFDYRLETMKACQTCGKWQSRDQEKCLFCPDGGRLELREQRIWGWIGVQRYLHTSDFGIDFLRNGRKILTRDKQLFDWVDPSGNEDPEREYPIDNPRNEGRIVGEVHCDHVAVNYQKNAFEYDTVEWRKVVRMVRGESPLRPNIASKRGFPSNRSPLAEIFTGYRTDKPGVKFLIPGDTQKGVALREKVTEWVAKFRRGDPEYLTDEVWYQAALQHDMPVTAEASATKDVLDEMGLTAPSVTDGAPKPETPGADAATGGPRGGKVATPPSTESADERLARYRADGSTVPALGGRFDTIDLGQVDVSVHAIAARDVIDTTGAPVPMFAHMRRAPKVDVYVAVRHAMLTDYGVDLSELVQMVVAEFLILRARGGKVRPLIVVLEQMKARASRDRRVTRDALAARARQLLTQVRDGMLREIKGSPTGYWDLLRPHERSEAERRFAIERGNGSWDDAIQSGDFMRFVPAESIVRLLERRPDAFFDGRVFRPAYMGLTDDQARALAVSRVVGLIDELALMADHTPSLSVDELLRIRLGCDLVERELADEE